MDKLTPFNSDEETIESWLEGFEARLMCHNINAGDSKRNWCQALVGKAGRHVIKNLPPRATWDQIKSELLAVLGESNPRDKAFDQLVSYRISDKGLGEVATDIVDKASRATDDVEMQHKLGLKAFLRAVPESISRDLRRKHFDTVREALDEARFLQRVQEEEDLSKDKVMVVDTPPAPSIQDIVQECLKQVEASIKPPSTSGAPNRERPLRRRIRCWCCNEEGHGMMQCPVVTRNRTAQQGAVPRRTQGNE